MNDRHNQSLMSLLDPPAEREQLASFVHAAVRAIGGRADADLGKAMGIPATTIANWKRRGVVSEQGRAWFQTDFIAAVAASSSNHLPTTEIAAIDLVLDAVAKSEGNPLGALHDHRFATAIAFGGMLAWAQFVGDASLIKGIKYGFADDTFGATFVAGLPYFRAFPALARFFD